jgi:hypothetical protein
MGLSFSPTADNVNNGSGSSDSRTDAPWGLLEPDAVKVERPVLRGPGRSNALGLPDRLSHTLGRTSVAFDDPNLVSAGGLVPVLALAESAGLRDLADEHLSVPRDKGANAGLKIASLVGGMVAGADSIDDMALLRHGGMGRVFARAYAPRRWARSCGRSLSATSASSTRSPRGS